MLEDTNELISLNSVHIENKEQYKNPLVKLFIKFFYIKTTNFHIKFHDIIKENSNNIIYENSSTSINNSDIYLLLLIKTTLNDQAKSLKNLEYIINEMK